MPEEGQKGAPSSQCSPCLPLSTQPEASRGFCLKPDLSNISRIISSAVRLVATPDLHLRACALGRWCNLPAASLGSRGDDSECRETLGFYFLILSLGLQTTNSPQRVYDRLGGPDCILSLGRTKYCCSLGSGGHLCLLVFPRFSSAAFCVGSLPIPPF